MPSGYGSNEGHGCPPDIAAMRAMGALREAATVRAMGALREAATVRASCRTECLAQ